MEAEAQLPPRPRFGQWEESTSRSRISFLFKGCLLEERIEGTRQGRPFTALALYGFNQVEKKYEWLFTDSEHGVLSIYRGTFDGEQFIFETSVNTSVGAVLLRRLVKKTDKGFEGRTQRPADQGKTWDNTSFFSYSK